jgi:hypothetical protein
MHWTVSGAILADFANFQTFEDKGKTVPMRGGWPIFWPILQALAFGWLGRPPTR